MLQRLLDSLLYQPAQDTRELRRRLLDYTPRQAADAMLDRLRDDAVLRSAIEPAVTLLRQAGVRRRTDALADIAADRDRAPTSRAIATTLIEAEKVAPQGDDEHVVGLLEAALLTRLLHHRIEAARELVETVLGRVRPSDDHPLFRRLDAIRQAALVAPAHLYAWSDDARRLEPDLTHHALVQLCNSELSFVVCFVVETPLDTAASIAVECREGSVHRAGVHRMLRPPELAEHLEPVTRSPSEALRVASPKAVQLLRTFVEPEMATVLGRMLDQLAGHDPVPLPAVEPDQVPTMPETRRLLSEPAFDDWHAPGGLLRALTEEGESPSTDAWVDAMLHRLVDTGLPTTWAEAATLAAQWFHLHERPGLARSLASLAAATRQDQVRSPLARALVERAVVPPEGTRGAPNLRTVLRRHQAIDAAKATGRDLAMLCVAEAGLFRMLGDGSKPAEVLAPDALALAREVVDAALRPGPNHLVNLVERADNTPVQIKALDEMLAFVRRCHTCPIACWNDLDADATWAYSHRLHPRRLDRDIQMAEQTTALLRRALR